MTAETQNILAICILVGGFLFWPIFRIFAKENLRRLFALKIIFFTQLGLFCLLGSAMLFGALRQPPMIDWGDLIFPAYFVGQFSIFASVLAIILVRNQRQIMLLILAQLYVGGGIVFAQQESIEIVPTIEFTPADEAVILSHVQVYPVLVVHRKPIANAPPMYISIYFRDCLRHYVKVSNVFVEAQTSDALWKEGFQTVQAENDGAFQSPLVRKGIEESMLNEEGKKMLRTNETYYLAEPENVDKAQGAIQLFQPGNEVTIALEFKLEGYNMAAKSLRHVFTLRGKKSQAKIIRYDNGLHPITESVTIPEIPSGCLQD